MSEIWICTLFFSTSNPIHFYSDENALHSVTDLSQLIEHDQECMLPALVSFSIFQPS